MAINRGNIGQQVLKPSNKKKKGRRYASNKKRNKV